MHRPYCYRSLHWFGNFRCPLFDGLSLALDISSVDIGALLDLSSRSAYVFLGS